MGHALGAALAARGFRVVSALGGRSPATRERAERARIEDVDSLEGLAREADVVLSVLPPAAAEGLAAAFAREFRRAGRTPLFADCNAISPDSARRIEKRIEEAGGEFVDGGLIGASPRAGRPATRLYVSGACAERLLVLGGTSEAGDIDVRVVGPTVGQASGLKMCYAGLTKGTMTLQTSVLLCAQRLGLFDELRTELEESQAQAWGRMAAIPFLPADAGRWIGEMQEIAATFRAAGVTPSFHEGAEAIFRLMDATPFAAETRETLDRSRTLEQTLRAFAELIER
jgi:3-hydroxyisobutyrate dehydrogenase-like beta-hydroxyacid dehydrogenase